MKCQCRNCYKTYDNLKSRGDYTGFCSAKCQHEKARELGYRKSKERERGRGEFQILNTAGCIGDVPVEEERVKLREELADLTASRYASPSRIETIKRLLKTRLAREVR